MEKPSLIRLHLRLAQCSRRSTTRHPRHFTTTPRSRAAAGDDSSVSASEVSHFSHLASSWWDPQGSSRILHEMNPLRHRFIDRCRRDAVGQPPSTFPARHSPIAAASSSPTSQPSARSHSASKTVTGDSFLDIGCGGGIFAETAARRTDVARVTAIDPTPECISVAKAHMRSDPLLLGKLRYLNCGIEKLRIPDSPAQTGKPGADAIEAFAGIPDQGADVVSVFEVVEHVNRPDVFLERCMRHVKPGGWLVGSTISRTLTSWVTTKFVAEDVLRIVPRGTHDWDKYITPYELRAWAVKQKGWGDWRTMGVVYVPGVGWREITNSESWGNYFFGLRRLE